MIKILVVDDHPIVRRGLREIIEDEHDMKVECEASSADEVLAKLRSHHIDVILLDISMPGKSGLDLIIDLKNEFPKKRILVISAHSEEIYAKRVLKNGAYGFINKESAPDVLVSAVRKVHSGKKFISPQLAELFADDMVGDHKKSAHEKLSTREFEVLRMLGKGKSIGEIANLLNLGATTVSTYRSRILSKMKLKNNSDIIQYCIREKLFLD